MKPFRTLGTIALLLTACAGHQRVAAAQDIAGGELPPTGYGSLRQDNVSLRMVSSDVEVRFLPLDERLTRLLAPDAYQSLHGLLEARRGEIDSIARATGLGTPGIVLVSFFGLRNGTQFDPQNVTLVYRSQLYRPLAVLAQTGNFTSRQLDVRQSATGLLFYEQPVPVYERFDVQYNASTATWNDEILRRIERERSRVQSKAQAVRPDSAAARP
ncbi:MAG TPA: hypothetical protein VG817_07600 [Gemmatimonadales bacterium]|nr:hypothetical protein [Gemmatimonadales bacterium]